MPPVDRQTATVDRNTDPAKAGRVIAKMASMDGDQYPEWLEPVLPPGLISHPHPGDTVEIETPEGEDVVEFAHEAKYLGKRYDDANDYPEKFKTNYPDRRGYCTPGDHYLIFDDHDKTITIETSGGHEIVLDDLNGKVRIKNSKSGDEWSNTVAGVSTIEASTKAHLSAPLTDLNDVATDFLIKGTTYNIQEQLLMTAFANMTAQWIALVAKWVALAGVGGPWIPQVDASEISNVASGLSQLSSALTAFQAAVATWTSLKTKTG